MGADQKAPPIFQLSSLRLSAEGGAPRPVQRFMRCPASTLTTRVVQPTAGLDKGEVQTREVATKLPERTGTQEGPDESTATGILYVLAASTLTMCGMRVRDCCSQLILAI